MSRGFRKILVNATGVAIMAVSVVFFFVYTLELVSPHIVFNNSPRFVRDTSGILDYDSRKWLEEQIHSKSVETDIAIFLDCQRTSFEMPANYIEESLDCIIYNMYDSQKYLIMTYFLDTSELVISTNIDGSSVSSEIVSSVNVNELVKEASYIAMKLSSERADLVYTDSQQRDLLICIFMKIIYFLLGLNIVLLNRLKKRKVKKESAAEKVTKVNTDAKEEVVPKKVKVKFLRL